MEFNKDQAGCSSSSTSRLQAMDAMSVVDTLPSPLLSSQQNPPDNDQLFGAVSSSSTSEDEQQDMEDDNDTEQEEVPLQQRAYLSLNESLREMLQIEDVDTILPNWSNEDIMGLIVQLTRFSMDSPESYAKIAQNFRDTTVEEIMECVNSCKELNNRASAEFRFRFNEKIASLNDKKQRESGDCVTGTSSDGNVASPNIPPHPNNHPRYRDWSSLLNLVRKSRKITDESRDVLAKFFSDCAMNVHELALDEEMPEYYRIYTHLSSMIKGYAIRSIRGIDAAVMFDIFAQMEEDIESMPALREFFKQMFADVQHQSGDDFTLNLDANEKNKMVGELMNPLGFPVGDEKMFDVSNLLPKKK